MYNLTIYPTFLCPFSCSFCEHKLHTSDNIHIPVEVIKQFLTNHNEIIDNITISGGEPMALNKKYFNEIIDNIKEFNKPITISSYMYDMTNYRDDVEYNLSYDFMARTRALEVWDNLLRFPKKFDLTITISPVIFKYHPNAILQKLSMLPNLKSVEFVPYLKNTFSAYDITKNNCLDKFNKMILSSKLNLPFKIINKEKLRSIIVNDKQPILSDICLLPPQSVCYRKFDESGIIKFEPLDITNLENISLELKYPDNIDLYSQQLVQWCTENEI